MPCFHPLKGFRGPSTAKGKIGIVFNIERSPTRVKMSVPCGQCVGCRLERSRQWAVRCVHEASLWEANCFLTLTYSDEYLPPDKSLNHRDIQLFLKRLRKYYGAAIRFYMCGEYGEQFGRPHFHLLLFNCDFLDKKFHTKRNGKATYTSKTVEKLWPFGFHEIGDVTFQSAGYVARYVMKKITGHHAEQHYENIDPDTGEITQRSPEYNQMSRGDHTGNPLTGYGIGYGWLHKYKTDVYPSDFLTLNGKKLKPPRYYDYHFEICSPKELQQIKSKRRLLAKKRLDNFTPERLAVREQVAIANLDRLPRNLK